MIIQKSHLEWLDQFKKASESIIGFRELRAEIFEQTVEIVRKGGYQLNNIQISVESDRVYRETYYYQEPQKLVEGISRYTTQFSVVEADCLEIAELLRDSGHNVCMLNMANRQNPGGGVVNGAGAQEENIFRRSNLFCSLYQYVDYSSGYGVLRNRSNSYPLDRNSGGIYSKSVTIFRGSERNGYCLLKKPFEISIVSVPALNRPSLELIENEYRICEELIEPTKEKIRTILRIAVIHNHDCLILSAFGCGAFCNPPKHVAELFKSVFEELEFKNRFKIVVFAIIDDHNSWKSHNPTGNILPFVEVF